MENNLIKLSLGDWTWNAAVTGFINIVGEENFSIDNHEAEISLDCLNDFEEKYFHYFTSTYEKTLPWYRIVSYKNTIEDFRKSQYDSFNLKKLENINKYIKDTVKKYLASNSFKAAYELIGNKDHIEKLGRDLQKIKEPKSDLVFAEEKNRIITEVEEQFKILEEIIEYCRSEKGKRYIRAKNVIYNVVNNGWNGVSFLNKQTKIKDVYEDYKIHFTDPAIKYARADKTKYKCRCFSCGEPTKDLSNGLSFVNQLGFDVDRKSSHVWDFQNDVAVCPVCKLVYSCLPAGLVYVGDRGVYINANVNIPYNIKVNRRIKTEILENDSNEYFPQQIYSVLVNALKEQQIKKAKYELADVQIINYENSKYRFSLLPEMTINLIDEFDKEITGLMKTQYKEGKEIHSIYEQVVNSIFNNQNLFLLINKLLHYKISSPNDCFFHLGHILNMLKINTRLIRNLGGIADMDKERNYLKEARAAGFHLRKAYLRKDPNSKKISGISYRLLNALKTANVNMFMDLVLNCYLYVGKEVPSIISETLREGDEVFRSIGYAFVASFIDGEKQNNEDDLEKKGEN